MLRKATEKCFFPDLHLSVKFLFLVVAADMFRPLCGAYCTLKSLVSPQMSEQPTVLPCVPTSMPAQQ